MCLTDDFEGALSVFTEMSYLAQERGGGSNGKPLGAYCDILARCEITRVLLLMLLQVNKPLYWFCVIADDRVTSVISL